MMAPAGTPVVVAFGDCITDGTASTMNGDDRWPDVLRAACFERFGNRVAVVNAGIGGNQVAGPAEYSAARPFPGGPCAGARLERDVLACPASPAVIWLEGTNDFSRNGNASVEAVQAAMRDAVGRIRVKFPQARLIGATVTSALNSTSAAHGFALQDEKRKALNAFIRTWRAIRRGRRIRRGDARSATGGLRPEMVPDSTTGGAGRPAASQSRRLPGDGDEPRPCRRGAWPALIKPGGR